MHRRLPVGIHTCCRSPRGATLAIALVHAHYIPTPPVKGSYVDDRALSFLLVLGWTASAHGSRTAFAEPLRQDGFHRCAGMSRGTVGDITAADLAELLADDDAAGRVQLIDVREEHEHEAASVAGFQLLPLSRCRLAKPEPKVSEPVWSMPGGPAMHPVAGVLSAAVISPC